MPTAKCQPQVTHLEPLSPPEKTQDPENAFNSETYQPGSQATPQLSREEKLPRPAEQEAKKGNV